MFKKVDHGMPSICIIIVLVLCVNATNVNGTENQVEYQRQSYVPLL